MKAKIFFTTLALMMVLGLILLAITDNPKCLLINVMALVAELIFFIWN